MEYITKLFGSDAGFRSHIWLEGKRLIDAGFKPGDTYTQVWLPDRIICKLGRTWVRERRSVPSST
jgi:hypothetical protein